MRFLDIEKDTHEDMPDPNNFFLEKYSGFKKVYFNNIPILLAKILTE